MAWFYYTIIRYRISAFPTKKIFIVCQNGENISFINGKPQNVSFFFSFIQKSAAKSFLGIRGGSML